MMYIYLFLISSLAFAQNEGTYDGQTPLSADELNTSEQYFHQGRAQRISDESCSNSEYSDICTNSRNAFKSDDAQKLETIMPMVSKVFATVVGASNLNYINKEKTALAAQKAPEGTQAETQTDSKQDYCGMIAGGVEAGAALLTQLNGNQEQTNLENSSPRSRQAQSFLAVGNTHKGLRDTARVQLGGWAATAACYGTMAVTGSVQTDPMFWVKLGGSVMMGTFYQIKQKHHNKRYQELKAMADALPNKGDCNPITETTCFCSEETSPTTDPINYQKYCVPKLIAQRGANASICVTSSGVADPNCNCKLTNSCLTHQIGKMGLDLNFGANRTQAIVDGISSFGKGFTGSNLKSVNDKNMAFAKKQLKNAPKLQKDPNLTKTQKQLASLATKLGIPKSLAASIAKLPSKSLPNNVANFEPSSINKKTNFDKKTVSFEKGRSSSRKSRSSSKSFNPFAKRGSKKMNAQSGIEINNEYYAKAQREAEITKDTSKPIFDIISYRYKKSAWKQLNSETKEIQK